MWKIVNWLGMLRAWNRAKTIQGRDSPELTISLSHGKGELQWGSMEWWPK